MSYSVYKLIDENGFVFYIGFTKNLETRIYEHGLLQGKNKAKDRKIAKIIEINGAIIVDYVNFDTLEEAVEEEKRLIKKYRPQLTNKHAGGNYVGHFIRPKTKKVLNRRSKCPICGKLFKQLSRHKCKEVKND